MDPIFGGISAVASIASGIMGASSAAKQNAAAKRAEKKQKKLNKKIARKTNAYNKKLDKADKANYLAMRDYSYNESIKNWERGKEILDYQHAARLKEFEKSQAIGNAQLGINAEEAAAAKEGELGALQDAFLKQQFDHESRLSALKQTYAEQNLNRAEQFLQLQGIKNRRTFGTQAIQADVKQMLTQSALQKESNLVESLVSEGRVSLGQAGRSTAKSRQANAAQLGRSIVALQSELSGKTKKAAIQLAELNAETSLAETGVGINLQRIDNAIANAEEEFEFNNRVASANMKSAVSAAQANLLSIDRQKRIADLNTEANMIIKPEKLPYDPRPTMPPERIFVERMEAEPGFVPPAQQQSVWAPLISGIGQAATTLGGVKW